MMNKASKKLAIGGASFLGLLFLSFFIFFPLMTFEINGKVFWTMDDSFTLRWIHSVEKEEWQEFYTRKGDTILLTKTRFKTFGAGVPSTPNDTTETSLEDGYVAMQIQRSFPSLELVVSENVQSTLVIGGKEIFLYELAGDYEPVFISVQKMSIWDMLLKGGAL